MHCSLSDRLQVAVIVQSPTSAVQVIMSSGLITGEESVAFFCFSFGSRAGFFLRGTHPPGQVNFTLCKKIPRRELICGDGRWMEQNISELDIPLKPDKIYLEIVNFS